MKAHHTLVAGDSGGGKTTLMRELHDTYPGLSIWINHHDESNVAGKRASGLRAIQTADRTTINLRVSDGVRGAEIAREACREYHEASGFPAQIIADEVQDGLLPDGSSPPDTPVKQGLHQDRDHAIKWVVASQDPSDLHYTPLKQIQHWIWVGPWSTFHEGFLRYFSIPRDDLPSEPYEWVKFDKRMTVTGRGTTKEKYG
jgi:hypothetical protein